MDPSFLRHICFTQHPVRVYWPACHQFLAWLGSARLGSCLAPCNELRFSVVMYSQPSPDKQLVISNASAPAHLHLQEACSLSSTFHLQTFFLPRAGKHGSSSVSGRAKRGGQDLEQAIRVVCVHPVARSRKYMNLPQ